MLSIMAVHRRLQMYGYRNMYTLASSICNTSMATANASAVAMLVLHMELAKVYNILLAVAMKLTCHALPQLLCSPLPFLPTCKLAICHL